MDNKTTYLITYMEDIEGCYSIKNAICDFKHTAPTAEEIRSFYDKYNTNVILFMTKLSN